jgi:hypothetical protein
MQLLCAKAGRKGHALKKGVDIAPIGKTITQQQHNKRPSDSIARSKRGVEFNLTIDLLVALKE